MLHVFFRFIVKKRHFYDTFCSTSNSWKACPGDTIKTRLAISNVGTTRVNIDYQLFFSKYPDYELDILQDKVSPSTHSFVLDKNKAIMQGRNFVVPNDVDYGSYYILIANANVVKSKVLGFGPSVVFLSIQEPLS